MNRIVSLFLALILFLAPSQANSLIRGGYASGSAGSCIAYPYSPGVKPIVHKKCKSRRNRSVSTVAIKKAIKAALKNRRKIIKVAEDCIGKAEAARIKKSLDDAEPILRKLLKYDELVWGMIEGHLANVVGRDIAFWIRICLEWMSPV